VSAARPDSRHLLAGAFAGVLILWVALLLGVIRGTTDPAEAGSAAGLEASILFCSDRATAGDGVGDALQLFRMSPAGLDKHRITSDPVCVAWEVAPGVLLGIREPDGPGGGAELVRYRQDLTNPIAEWRQDTVFHQFSDVVAWDPGLRTRSGEAVLTARDADGRWDLYRVLSGGDSIVRLTDDDWVEGNPARDPENPAGPIVYTRFGTHGDPGVTAGNPGSSLEDSGASYSDLQASLRPGGGDLYAVSPEGGQPRRLTRDPLLDDLAQVHGDSVIFVRGRGVGREDGNMELILLRMSDGVEERLTDNRWNDYIPAWSPDGRWICWQSEEDGHYEMNVRVMSLSDRRERILVDWPGRQGQCSWAPDGRAILVDALADGDWDTFRVPLDGSEAVDLTRYPGADDKGTRGRLWVSPVR